MGRSAAKAKGARENVQVCCDTDLEWREHAYRNNVAACVRALNVLGWQVEPGNGSDDLPCLRLRGRLHGIGESLLCRAVLDLHRCNLRFTKETVRTALWAMSLDRDGSLLFEGDETSQG